MCEKRTQRKDRSGSKEIKWQVALKMMASCHWTFLVRWQRTSVGREQAWGRECTLPLRPWGDAQIWNQQESWSHHRSKPSYIPSFPPNAGRWQTGTARLSSTSCSWQGSLSVMAEGTEVHAVLLVRRDVDLFFPRTGNYNAGIRTSKWRYSLMGWEEHPLVAKRRDYIVEYTNCTLAA